MKLFVLILLVSIINLFDLTYAFADGCKKESRREIIDNPDAGDEVWLDGDAVRAYLYQVKSWLGTPVEPFINNLDSGCLLKGDEDLQVFIYLNEKTVINLKTKRQAKKGEIYQIIVPRLVKFKVRTFGESAILFSELDSGGRNGFRFKVKLPFLPDTAYLREVFFDPFDGTARLEAGVIGNSFIVIARAKVMSKSFEGVDVWESVIENLESLVTAPMFFVH